MADEVATNGANAESNPVIPASRAIPETAGAPNAPAVSHAPADMKTDIQAILESVGLPERHEFHAGADKPIAPAPMATEPVPAPAPVIAPVHETTPPTDTSAPALVAMHTLKDDIQHVVRDEKMSLVRAASLEQDRKMRDADAARIETEGSTQRSKRTFAILFVSALLIVVGGAAIFGVLAVLPGPAPASQQADDSLIFAEQSLQLPLDGTNPSTLKSQIAGARQGATGNLGSITRIIPTISTTTTDGTQGTRMATTAEFLHALGADVPDELVRALGSTFFFGLHAVDKNAPVLVIPVTSYEHAFAGMLAWEKTMNPDLAPVFTAVSAYQTDANGIPAVRTFQDQVMRNYDTRILADDSGNVQLYYSFPNTKLLIIAESPYSFPEILSRLRAARHL